MPREKREEFWGDSLSAGLPDADISCIRLEEEFIFLVVILDAYSRRVIGWSLDDTMAESLTVAALKMALSEREVPPGLVPTAEFSMPVATHRCSRITASRSA